MLIGGSEPQSLAVDQDGEMPDSLQHGRHSLGVADMRRPASEIYEGMGRGVGRGQGRGTVHGKYILTVKDSILTICLLSKKYIWNCCHVVPYLG